MPIGEQCSIEEWREIVDSVSFRDVSDEELMRLHRHWIWANFSKRQFEDALMEEWWSDVENWSGGFPYAMFLWYGLLHAVVAGYSARRDPVPR